MYKKDKEFYIWTMAECIKDTYEYLGLDIMSLYCNISKEFPNAIEAIHKMYSNFKSRKDCYNSDFLTFEKVQYVYEGFANLIPNHKQLQFDLKTSTYSNKYNYLNIISSGKFVTIERINLIMAVLLFTEEFILQHVDNSNVILTDSEIIVNGTFVMLKVSKLTDVTHIYIIIKDVICLQYLILN